MATLTPTSGTENYDGVSNTTSGADTINVATGTANAGDVWNGGGGTDTINLTTTGDGVSLDLTVVTISNIENMSTVDGGSGTSYDQTLTMSATQWDGFSWINMNDGTDVLNVQVSGTMNISAGGVTLVSSVTTGNLTGTSGTDVITLSGSQLNAILIGSGTINLGTGSGDTVTLTSTSTDLTTLGATDASIQGVEAISAAGAAAAVTINMTAQTESFALTGSSNGDTITGGSGADTINAGDGNDTINLANGHFVAGETINGGNGTDSIVLTTVGATVDLSTGTISGVETLTGGGAGDTVTLSGTQWAGFTTLDLAGGTDAVNVVANGDISSLGTPTLSGIETGNLTGTTGTDTITLTGAQLDAILIGSGTISLGTGSGDTITLTSTSTDLTTLGATDASIQGVEAISAAGAAAAVTINLTAQTESFALTGSSNADQITGGSGADTIDAGDGDDSINLATGHFVSGESINGGDGTDSIVLSPAGATVDFSVGTISGIETLTGGGVGDTIKLSGTQWAGFTTINLAGGTDVVNVVANGDISSLGTPALSGVETGNLTGTTGTDTITLTGAQLDAILIGSGTINLDTGSGDTINLTSTSADLNTLGATDASIQGVEAISAAGAGAGVTISVSGQTEAFTLTGSSNGDTITGGSGDDIITGGGGNDTLSGGSGANDTVVLSGDWANYTIIDNGGGSYTITDNVGGDGSDAVSNFDSFTFNGSTYTAAQIVNDAPADMTLSASAVTENASNGTVVGSLSTTDADTALGDTAAYTLLDDAGGRFTLSGGSIVVADGSLLDRELNTSHSITVRVTDAKGATYDETFSITVTDVNDVAPAITSGATASVAENAAGTVYAASATDPDTVGSIAWSLSGDDAALFSIDASGNVTFNASPDFEAPADLDGDNVYDLVVHANDGVQDTTKVVAITVTDVNDVAPTITSGAAASVSENVAGTVYAASATDPDTVGSIAWSLTGDDAALFSIDASGNVTFNASPDFEAPVDLDGDNVYDLVVHANDGVQDTTKTVAITVTDVNDVAPTITSGATASVAENVAGTVYAASATDPDTVGSIAWSLSGDDAALFSIDASGNVTFNASPDFEAPADLNGDNVYDLVVHANDGVQDTTKTVAITVTDVNDVAPAITSGAAASVSENVAGTVYAASATDPDTVGSIAWSLSGDDAALFSIDASGNVTFNASPDFEAPADLDGDNVYDLVVHANDGVQDTTKTVAITVTDVNDVAPAITSGAAASVSENVAGTVYAASATDPDTVGSIAWSLSGDDAALFSIDASGNVTFNASPDFEAPADLDGDNVYDLVVHANDGVQDTTKTVAITVTDVNDVAPTITSGATASVAENVAGTVYAASATDPDTVGSIAWSLSGDDAALFSIDASGNVTFNASPDFEAPADLDGDNVYDLVVHANDGVQDTTKTVAITVTDVNDVAPTITSGAAASVSENVSGTIYAASATDPDTVGSITWSLSGDDAALFSIDASGNVTFNASPDFEAPADLDGDNVYDLVVHANDGVQDTTKTVAITVTDVNDVAPTITSGAAASVSENVSGTVYAASATDPDTVGSITWSLSGDDAALFSIDASGNVTFNASPDFEAPADLDGDNVYDLVVHANDGVQDTTKTVAITVTDVNDVAPTITSGAAASVSENVSGTVYAASATDPDTVGSITWSLSGDDAALFSIDASGNVTFNASPDFEAPADLDGDNVYDLVVHANDGVQDTTKTVAITVTDVNDVAPTITSGAAASVSENVSGTVYAASATDPDTVGSITWSLSGDDAALFSIDASGNVTFNASPDFEAPADLDGDNVYDLVVHANDGVQDTTKTVAITVTDVNDVAPTITSGAAASVSENVSGTIYAASATDPDTVGSITWSLSGDDAALFSIDASGNVTFNASPDFEAPADLDGDNVYDLVVHANDGVQDTTKTVAITVTDVNDVAPTITSGAAASVSENVSGTVYAASATDPDTVGSITWSLSGDDAALFSIDASGNVTFNASPDFEAPADLDGDNVYDLVVHANDGVQDTTKTVAITVTDVNDVAPTITSGAAASVSENVSGTVYAASATDPDTVGSITWSLSGDDAALFSIDASGNVTFNASPDFEAPADLDGDNVYDLVVHANDGVQDTTKTVAITVTDVNDVAPTITSGAAASVSENVSGTVYAASATDPDTVGSITWSLSGDDAALFSIDASGNVTFNASPDFEAPADLDGDNVYDLVVHANDGVQDTTKTVAITVTDEAPVINDPAGNGAGNITGTAENDTINGLGGNDIVDGGLGNDTMSGNEGDDTLLGGAGADTLIGGDDSDTADYSASVQGVTVNLLTGIGADGDAAGDTYATIENIVGSGEADTLTGDGNANIISGGAGADNITGGDGNDTLAGGNGADVLAGGTGSDTVDYSASSGALTISLANQTASGGDATGDIVTGFESVIGGNQADQITGSAAANTLSGGDGDDTISAAGGIDTLNGGAGSDMLTGGAGADALFGGTGTDTASYTGSATGVTVNLATGVGSGGDAQGDTLDGIENLNGSSQADTLTGNGDANDIAGNSGADSIDGGDGDDAITGGAGADTLTGGTGIDTLNYEFNNGALTIDLATGIGSGGYATGDTVSGFENVLGGESDDDITGNGDANILTGALGNDTIQGGAGADTLSGGDGTDTLSYSASLLGVTVSLASGTGTGGDAQGDTLSGFENLIGSGAGDTLSANGGANTISGGAGDDTISGGSGDDVVSGGEGADTMTGSAGIDTLDYSASDVAVDIHMGNQTASGGDADGDTFSAFENLIGSNYSDIITGTSIANILDGGSGSDLLQGAGGNDTLIGGSGNDKLIGGSGADVLTGGEGTDTANYGASSVAVTVNLFTGAGSGGDAQGDTLSGIENLLGTDFDDNLTGSDAANVITGGLGNDTIDGGAGDDYVTGGVGADALAGGSGVDTVNYDQNAGGVTINLETESVTGGRATGDTISGFENVIGSGNADQITGNAAANILSGAAGQDRLQGGLGADTLTGGNGCDTFVFALLADSTVGAGHDMIADFNQTAQDKLDLSAIDAVQGGGDDAFHFTASGGTAAFSNAAGELRFFASGGETLVQGDVNGDGTADFEIALTGSFTLTAVDFIL